MITKQTLLQKKLTCWKHGHITTCYAKTNEQTHKTNGEVFIIADILISHTLMSCESVILTQYLYLFIHFHYALHKCSMFSFITVQPRHLNLSITITPSKIQFKQGTWSIPVVYQLTKQEVVHYLVINVARRQCPRWSGAFFSLHS